VVVQPDLSLPGHPEISVIGDLAAAKSHAPGQEPKPVPGVSPGAKQMGRAAAANLLRRLRGEPTRPFRYRDYGNLATIGRNSAVVDLATPLGPLRFSGLLAWLFWLFAHIYFLIGFRNRIVVLIDWASAYWSSQRYARVLADIEPAGPKDLPATEAPAAR
jgi:NADH dehydrogenase